ncbi:hypothetical protein [Nannocystis sp.]|uniref:hypothetical protein n=1 Tax=Nannocystis sp. TaxID=1962667 RepID=UPI0025D537DB|nr:hypothetical protein [Nannocystis sp.]MBK7830547.1 hypothetical protein [Nannocystis sp.]
MLKVHADDSQFIVDDTTFKLVKGVGAFYQSLASDGRRHRLQAGRRHRPDHPGRVLRRHPEQPVPGHVAHERLAQLPPAR